MRIEVGCPCPPICNNIVTPCHFLLHVSYSAVRTIFFPRPLSAFSTTPTLRSLAPSSLRRRLGIGLGLRHHRLERRLIRQQSSAGAKLFGDSLMAHINRLSSVIWLPRSSTSLSFPSSSSSSSSLSSSSASAFAFSFKTESFFVAFWERERQLLRQLTSIFAESI